ncbi:MAG: hypothetical protein LBT20_03430, partial [Clostridiales bacterium]|nr:hypothetical protein [Clostridiales bacterium]
PQKSQAGYVKNNLSLYIPHKIWELLPKEVTKDTKPKIKVVANNKDYGEKRIIARTYLISGCTEILKDNQALGANKELLKRVKFSYKDGIIYLQFAHLS